MSQLFEQALREIFDRPRMAFSSAEDVYSFGGNSTSGQAAELFGREQINLGLRGRTKDQLLGEVAQHHSFAVMGTKARAFRASLAPSDWIVDIGGGTGWYWMATRGARVVLVDFSRETLSLAQSILSEADEVLCLHANAESLPIASSTISGLWSVQVLQHMPDLVLGNVVREAKRILRPNSRVEICNLNPNLLNRGSRWLRLARGARLPVNYELNVAGGPEWRACLAPLARRPENARIQYSELFFHPRLHFRPVRYPISLENILVRALPLLARWMARQVNISIDNA